MKKLVLATLVILVMLFLSSPSWAVGTMTQGLSSAGIFNVLTITWIAHTDGSFTAADTSYRIDGLVLVVVTDPGSPAPTDNYGITLKDSDGYDIMGGALASRDTANTEAVQPTTAAGGTIAFPVYGVLTVGITGNSQNAATGEIKIYFIPN